MDFFKSVFSDDPTSPPDSPNSPSSPPVSDPDPALSSAWSFGGLVKTLATKSESVIQSYRKDFEEFGSGLRIETAVIRKVASRAITDLPTSLEAGASVAQESLETVGQAIDDIGATVWKSTAQIISHGRDSIAALDHIHGESNTVNFDNNSRQLSMDMKRYSRFEMQVRAVQSDLDTYCSVPDDEVDYEKWVLESFKLEEKKEEIELIIENNEVVRQIYDDIVPDKVDNECFWSRYFYRIHKLKQVEEARALLVKRAISGEEEELSWDIDDDVDDKAGDEEVEESLSKGESSSSTNAVVEEDKSGDENAAKSSGESDDNKVEGKGENGGGSCKDSDVSLVSSHRSFLPEEEDLGWDDVEDIGSSDDSKGRGGAGTSRLDLRKRLSAADEDEDLSWDIEDEDDEASKQ